MSCTTYRFENGSSPSAAWTRLYGPTVVDMAVATAKAGYRAVARWRSERRAVEHLHSLSDHQLRDLGIVRDQIIPVVLGQRSGSAHHSAE